MARPPRWRRVHSGRRPDGAARAARGTGPSPGDPPRLRRLDGLRAEQYGYVNRTVADDELDHEVDRIASRLSLFDHEAIARTKFHVDRVTLPPDGEFPPALSDFFQAFGRPGTLDRARKLVELGLNVDSELERHLGTRVVGVSPGLTGG